MAQLTQGAIVVVDDGSSTASALITRVGDGISEPIVVRVRGAGTSSAPTAVEVGSKRKVLTAGVAEAKRRGLLWMAVPRDFDRPKKLLGSLLKAEGTNATAAVPGLAVWFRSPDAADAYRRALVVADVRDEVTSGLGVRAAIAIAVNTGAELDVALLGVPRDADLSTRERRLDALKVGRNRDTLASALDLADEHGITVSTYHPMGNPDDAGAAVMDLLVAGEYDVVLDDLGDVNLGRLRRGKALKSLFAPGHGAGELPLRLLREAPCDVVLVIDDVRVGSLPAGLLKTGAVGAMTLGTLGVAAPANASPAPTTAAVTSTVAAGTTDTGSGDAAGEIEAGAEAKDKDAGKDQGKDAGKDQGKDAGKDQGKADEAKTPEKVEVPDDLTQEQVEQKQAEAAQASQQREEAAAQLEQADMQANKMEKKTSKVSEDVAKTQMAEEQAAYDLALAEQELAESQAALADAESAASGLGAILPGAPSEEDIAAAEADVAAAEQQLASEQEAADEAREDAEKAYAQYQDFIKDVEKANQNLSQAEKDLVQAKERAATTTSEADAYAAAWEDANQVVMPGTGEVTSPFGYRVHPITGDQKLHAGIDFAVGDGNIYSFADGTVSFAGYDEGGYGNYVIVDHGEYNGHQIETLYGHQPDLQVAVGDEVEAGEQIGNVGTSGGSTGLHLHFEIHVDGEPIDPAPHLPG